MTNVEQPPILVVEDNDEDFDVLRLLLVSIGVRNPLKRCATSGDALAAFARIGLGRPGGAPMPGGARADRLPSLVLLDLNLPGIDGRELLQRFRADPGLRGVPVVVFSTSANPRDVRFCYEAGANAYMVKPVDLDRPERMLRATVEFWLNAAVVPAEIEDAA
jgi:CheY-like chemotaxis protein